MKCVSFIMEFQPLLDNFFDIMYSSRGLLYEPEGRHKDIRNIYQEYQLNGGDFWIIKSNNKVIGSVGLRILDKDNGVGEIKRMNVLPDEQGKGYGRLLINHLIQAARQKSLCLLRLDTMKSYERALNLYRRTGFYEIERYNDNMFGEVFMEMTL